ncbi:MAG: DUF5320 domain-containing protein [Bacteroidales bacterium]|nr:DUF5320 domain-containing protein [Bacteroidales bacterium]
MPGFNRKGPNNEGPMSGRAMGLCNPENRGKANMPEDFEEDNRPRWGLRGFFRGRGMSRGMGRGRGFRFRGGDF